MTHFQQIIAGDHETWHEFMLAIFFIIALAGLFIIYMNKARIGAILFNCLLFLLFLLWLAMPVIRVLFSVYNFFARLIYNIRVYNQNTRLTAEEENDLNETVFLGI